MLLIKEDVEQRATRLKPARITFEVSSLDTEQRSVLWKLVQASDLMSEIFLRQVSPMNPQLRSELQESGDPQAKKALHYFNVCFGPWDRLSGNEPFIGSKPKPPGAGFYPDDMSKEEFERWLATHPSDSERMRSLHMVVKRQDGKLIAVPYSEEYSTILNDAAGLLKEAADTTRNASLRRFLRSRADAFLSDDYYQSDLDWMDLDSEIEVTIGPYEVYEDGLFGYKTAFESFVTVNDLDAARKLEIYAKHLPDMEKHLPMPDQYKNPRRGSESPIRVVNEIYTGGDARKGIQISAFNLPNDERVREAKGSKKVLLRNVMEAKFKNCLRPVAERLIESSQLDLVTFEAYFNHVLFHELSHGLGPGKIVRPDGVYTEVRLELKELYSAIEEAKADVLGTWNLLYMIEEGVVDCKIEEQTLVTVVAGLFRAARFGVHEAHGRGVVMQYNYFREQDAVSLHDSRRYFVEMEALRQSVKNLTRELLMVEAEGDYSKASRLLNRYGQASKELEGTLNQLSDLPIDIEPIYETAEIIRKEHLT